MSRRPRRRAVARAELRRCGEDGLRRGGLQAAQDLQGLVVGLPGQAGQDRLAEDLREHGLAEGDGYGRYPRRGPCRRSPGPSTWRAGMVPKCARTASLKVSGAWPAAPATIVVSLRTSARGSAEAPGASSAVRVHAHSSCGVAASHRAVSSSSNGTPSQVRYFPAAWLATGSMVSRTLTTPACIGSGSAMTSASQDYRALSGGRYRQRGGSRNLARVVDVCTTAAVPS